MSDAQDSLLAPVKLFLRQSRELLKLAHANDWQAFEEHLAEREAGLSSLGESRFLVEVAKAGRAEELRAGILEIQRLNDEIVSLAEKSKAELSAELKESLKADKGIQAYQSTK